MLKPSFLVLIALLGGIASVSAQPDYPPAHWVPPACTKSYASGNGHFFCVIHDIEGYYESAISYLNRCDTDTNGNFNVSASVHYLVNGLNNGMDEDGHAESNSPDSVPGDVTQSVRESRYAWHARCWNTWMFGTEHEGFVSSPVWYTEAMYQSSAALQRYLCNKYGIPKDRNHIIGHNEWQNAAWRAWMTNNFPAIDPTCNNHTDPGIYWDWNHFMALVNGGPGIITQPRSQVIEPGSNVAFTVVCTNITPAFYQWRKNGLAISGATSSAYAISNAQPAHAGGYSVVITNSLGSITSRVATLTVTPIWTAAFVDNFETNSSSRWNLFWGAGNGIMDFSTNWAFNYGTASYVANGVTNLIPSAPNSGGTTRGLKLTVNKDATAATAGVSLYPKNLAFSNNYCLRFDMWINYNGGPGGGVGSTEYGTCGLNHTGTRVNWITSATSSDGFWFAVDGEGGSGGSDYRAYLGNGAAPTQLTFANSGLGANGALLDNVSDPFFQAQFPSPAYESAGVPGKHWVQCELMQINNIIYWQINGVVIAQRANTSSYSSGAPMIGYMDPYSSIANPAADNFVLFDNVRVFVPAAPPVLVLEPRSQSVKVGTNAVFTVSANGTAPFAYQWRFDGANLPAATNSSYTRFNVQTNDAGNYSVFVSNIAGTALSSNAFLTVLPLTPLRLDTISLLPSNQVRISLNGEPGSYIVQTSTNLLDWTTLTNVVITNSFVEIFDDATGTAQRFYRAAPEP